jgi:abortive infection bacteriophage resistance protein
LVLYECAPGGFFFTNDRAFLREQTGLASVERHCPARGCDLPTIVVSVARVPFNKPALSPADLLAHLGRRGLNVSDAVAALHALEYIDYYRLLTYMRPYQRPNPLTGNREFVVGTTFEDVITLYNFDRRLRLLCLDAVERIEVALRAAIVSEVAVSEGAHFHLDPSHFDRIADFVEFYQTVSREDRHIAVKHYRKRYSTPEQPPIWASMEALTFGALSRLFSGLALRHRKAVSVRFGYDETVLASWFRAVNLVRNICAHHGRLWNAPMHVDQPLAERRLRAEMIPTDRLYARFVVLAALLAMTDPASDWKHRLLALVAAHPGVPLQPMGIPPGWEVRPFWAS